MSRLDLSPNKQHKLLSRIAEKSNLNGESLARICRVHPRTFRDWKRGKYKVSDQALRRLCDASGVAVPKTRVLPEFWSTRKAGRLGALTRYRLYGNPGTPEGRRKAGLLLVKWIRANPKLAKQRGVDSAKEIRYPLHSPLLAELIGILIGDGGIRSPYQVTISFNRATDMAYARWLQGVVSKLFGLDSFVLLEKKNLGGAIIISSVRLVRYLKEVASLRPGNKLRNGLDVPAWIWKRRSYQVSCLRGLMDTDGGPFIHRYQVNGKWYAYPKLSFCSLSPQLRRSVLRLFRDLSFHPRLARNSSVFIDRCDEAKQFYRTVGSRHKRHHALIHKFV